MTDRLDPALTALERRLERASPPTAPTGLRRRVLTAVDDVLQVKATPSTSGREREPLARRSPDLVAIGIVSFAIAVSVAVVTFTAASMPPPGVPLTLEDRARIAGVNDMTMGALLAGSRSATPALRASRGAEIPVQPKTLRVFDGHRLFQETL